MKKVNLKIQYYGQWGLFREYKQKHVGRTHSAPLQINILEGISPTRTLINNVILLSTDIYV